MQDLKILFGQQILAWRESLPSKNKNRRYLFCVIDASTKYTWVNPLKDEKRETVLNAFIDIVIMGWLKKIILE